MGKKSKRHNNHKNRSKATTTGSSSNSNCSNTPSNHNKNAANRDEKREDTRSNDEVLDAKQLEHEKASKQRRIMRGINNNNQKDYDDEEETADNLRFQDPFVEEYIQEDADADAGEDWEDIDEEKEDDDEDDDADDKGYTSKEEVRNPRNKKGHIDHGGNSDVEIIQSWNPLTCDALPAGEKLEMDPAAYKMYHAISAEWPALSFDFIRDDMGESRSRFPHSLISVFGTQANRPDSNNITVMKLSDLSKLHIDNDDDILGEEYNPDDNNNDDDSDSDDSDDEMDSDPIMEHYSIRHHGGVNRIRVMPQRSNIVATWSDIGRVNLYDVSTILSRFDLGSSSSSNGNGGGGDNDDTMMNNDDDKAGRTNVTSSMTKPIKPLKDIPKKPFFSYSKHRVEGYALDWSPTQEGRLITGDCTGRIHLWTPRNESGGSGNNDAYVVTPSYDEPRSSSSSSNMCSSIEDLQWSPTESTVFASAECSGYVRIFDTRAPKRSMLCHRIHKPNKKGDDTTAGDDVTAAPDVNVLSWNKLVTNLLATGGDDGTLSVWDLRHFGGSNSGKGGTTTYPEPLARLTTHKTPITSVEWHPTDESMLAVSDDVGTYVYDLSVEEDKTSSNDHIPFSSSSSNNSMIGNNDIPPQLLFVHCGSEQFKEVHWHPQITSCLMTTALSGFSTFIPSNL